MTLLTLYDDAGIEDDSDIYTNNTNTRGIWRDSINVDQRNSNSTVTAINNQSSVLNKSSCADSCASSLPASYVCGSIRYCS